MTSTNDLAEGSGTPPCYPFSRSPAEVRVQWMRLYGMSEDEIIQSLKDDPPDDIREEETELDSVVSIREHNADKCRYGCVIHKAVKEYCDGTTSEY